MNHVECFDIPGNRWIEKAPMIIPREGATSCVFEGPLQIYVFGGANIENDQVDSIE